MGKISAGSSAKIVLLASTVALLATSPSIASFIPAPNTAVEHYAGDDSKMVCGKVGANGDGDGYAFTQKQTGGNFDTYVTRYAATSVGVTSTAMGAGVHILPGRIRAFSVTGLVPFHNTAYDAKLFMFGGLVPGNGPGFSYSNFYYRYSPTGFPAGFRNGDSTPIGTTPTPMGSISGRAGIASVAISENQILLIGGYDNGGAKTDVFLFDQVSGTFTARAPLPAPLQNAKTLVSGSGRDRWVYVMGGDAVVNSASNSNRRIYRYQVKSNSWITLKTNANLPLELPPTNDFGGQLQIASVEGAMLILMSSNYTSPGLGTGMTVFRVTHPTNATTGGGATLTPRVYDVPDRSRDGFSLLRCSADAWVIGGMNGKGPSLSNRRAFVDKLKRN